jgi:hypothetical protein
VRGGTALFKEYVLKESGYVGRDGKPLEEDPDFKVKERVIARDINVTMEGGGTQKKKVYEKQVVFWSKKHCEKTRAERAEIIAKAEALIADPNKFTKATSYGAAAYVGNIEYDKESGEVQTNGKYLFLDKLKIEDEQKYDGYYSIVTSELDMASSDIVDTYRGLWEIEETFKITKSDLEARPVYVYDEENIKAHFLICFIALTIVRLMHKRINREYSPAMIIDCLNKIQCFPEDENIYLFGFRNAVCDLLGNVYGIDFMKRRLKLSAIKNILAVAKNQ